MNNSKNRHTTPETGGPEKDPVQAPATPAENGAKERPPQPGDEAAVWEKRIEEAQAETERFKDQLLRKAAEFENYKRRTEIDWQNMQRYASEKVLLAFLPILDDLVRSLKSGAEQKNFDAFYQGVDLISQKMLKTFKAQGVEPVEAAGKPFNVDEHDALLQIPRADVPPHTVLEEVEKGYRLGDRVLRHAKVIVSAEQPAPVPGSDKPETGKPPGGKQGGEHDAT